jgi:hypothetical protein
MNDDGPWKDEDASGGVGTFSSVVGTGLGIGALYGMAFSSVYQFVTMIFGTLMTMLALGGVSYFVLAYNGGGTSTGEEVAVTAGAVVVVLLSALVPLTSAFSALYVATCLWRGGRPLPVIVASVASMAGPLFMVVPVSLFIFVMPVAGVVVTAVAILSSVVFIATAGLAIVVVSRSPVR